MRFFNRTGLHVMPLCLGLLFFAASLTPTLIPRHWLVQGILGGVVMGLGHLIGRFALAIWRLMDSPEPTGRVLLIARLIAGIPVLVILALCLLHARGWQNGIRSRMGMELVDSAHTLRMIALALVVFVGLVLIGYALQWLFDRVRFRLYRYLPARAANVAGFLITAALVTVVTRDGVLDRVIAGLDTSVTIAQNLFDTAPPVPMRENITGGFGSLVSWEALGQPGRDHVMTGPSAADIAAFTGREAMQPIRVYVGRAQADSAQQRADIALAELVRKGGFDREVLIIAMPTGTGWLGRDADRLSAILQRPDCPL